MQQHVLFYFVSVIHPNCHSITTNRYNLQQTSMINVGNNCTIYITSLLFLPINVLPVRDHANLSKLFRWKYPQAQGCYLLYSRRCLKQDSVQGLCSNQSNEPNLKFTKTAPFHHITNHIIKLYRSEEKQAHKNK